MKQHIQLWKPPMANVNLAFHTILPKADILNGLHCELSLSLRINLEPTI